VTDIKLSREQIANLIDGGAVDLSLDDGTGFTLYPPDEDGQTVLEYIHELKHRLKSIRSAAMVSGDDDLAVFSAGTLALMLADIAEFAEIEEVRIHGC